MDQIIVFAVGIMGGASIAGLWGYIASLRKEIEQKNAEIERLKAANALHMPFKAIEHIENATAAMIAAKLDLEKNKLEIDFKESFIDNGIAHLQKLRGESR